MRETGLRLTACSRSERFSEGKMKRLGRLVSTELPLEYVRFSHRAPTVAVDLVGYSGPIPQQLAEEIARIIGDFKAAGFCSH